MPTFALNFSRPGSEVIAQYFMFVSLGADGYRAVQRASSAVAQHIAAGVAEIGPYRLITDGSDLPVFAFTLAPEVRNYTVFDVSARLREMGWLVPAYTFPENRHDLPCCAWSCGPAVTTTWPTCSSTACASRRRRSNRSRRRCRNARRRRSQPSSTERCPSRLSGTFVESG